MRCVSRVSREAALDVNTEPSQSEQIVWDDPTAREERAKLADNLQWPGSPSQHSEPLAPAPPPSEEASSQLRDSMTDSELVEIGKTWMLVVHLFKSSFFSFWVILAAWVADYSYVCVPVHTLQQSVHTFTIFFTV